MVVDSFGWLRAVVGGWGWLWVVVGGCGWAGMVAYFSITQLIIRFQTLWKSVSISRDVLVCSHKFQ